MIGRIIRVMYWRPKPHGLVDEVLTLIIALAGAVVVAAIVIAIVISR